MLESGGFMPHGMCFLWQPDVLLLHVVSDALIAVAYFSIPLLLVYLVRRRTDFPFSGAVWMFSAFIVSCGLTHIAAIVVIWHPVYWVEGWIKALTALLSIMTVIMLVPLLPRILALRSVTQLERANIQLHADSVTDVLTGLANRRGFDVRLREALGNSRRSDRPTSLMMIDVDHFKAFNDTFGHPRGDECLQMTADVIKAAVTRPRDLVARLGGEEFVVIMEDTDAGGAFLLAERIRARVAEQRFPQGEGAQHPVVTVSVGTATARVGEDMTAGQLMALADRAVYQAKAGGRNCVSPAYQTRSITTP